jgi:hypothetical protein
MRDAISRDTQIRLDDVEEISSLYIKFKKISDEIENFIVNNNKKMLKKFRNVLMNENKDFSNNFQKNLIYSIIHFLAIAEINDVLFALLEEIKKSLHYLINNDEYNKDKNYFDFFRNGVLFDSSQINFNYLSALLSNTLIDLLGDDITYLICLLSNIGILILLYFVHLENVKYEYSNEFTHFIKILLFYIFIYTFTGIVALIPFYSMNNRFSGENIIAINSFLFLGVLFKYVIHIILFNIGIADSLLFLIKLGIFVLCSFIYLFIHIIKFKNNENKSNSYFIGKLTYRNKSSSIILKFQNLGGYIKSLIYSSVIIIFILNFFSRAQKIAFKSQFKDDFDKSWLMPLNFFLSYAIYIIIMIIYNYIQKNQLKIYGKNNRIDSQLITISQSEILIEENEQKDDNNSSNYIEKAQERDNIKKLIKNLNEQRISNKMKEKFIFSCIFVENFLSLCLSIIYKIFVSNRNPDKKSNFTSESIICYSSILISGSINFILTEYYSSQKIEYFSLSGIICFSQVIFRIVELIHSLYKDDWWIYFQITVSFLGCVISFFSNDIIEKILKQRKKLLN